MGALCCAESQVYDEPSKVETKYWNKFLAGIPSLEGKTVAITGCTTGTGRVLADACGAKGATVILLNRPSDRSAKMYDDLKAKYGASKVVDIPCDLMSFKSVKSAAQQVTAKCASTGIDALVNNAGIMAYLDGATEDGCDVQMQTNHLSHFMLTKELFPLLQKVAQSKGDARIVNHSSIASGMTDALKPEYFGKNGGNLGGDVDNGPMTMTGPAWERYAQTKLANAVFTFALKDKLAASGSKVKAVAAHPGVAATELQVQTIKKGTMSAFTANMVVSQSAEDGTMGIMQGVAGPVTSGDVWGPGGMGFAGEITNLGETWLAKPSYSDPKAHAMMWSESEKTTGCEFKV